jgi:hypothetical protein
VRFVFEIINFIGTWPSRQLRNSLPRVIRPRPVPRLPPLLHGLAHGWHTPLTQRAVLADGKPLAETGVVEGMHARKHAQLLTLLKVAKADAAHLRLLLHIDLPLV